MRIRRDGPADTRSVSVHPDGSDLHPSAGLGRTLRIARPVRARLALTCSLGAGAVLADIGLIATAAWLVSAAAGRPNESRLALAIVGVQFFGLSRGLLRYGERLAGHAAALELLAHLRVRCYERLEQLAPAGLLAFRRGDLLTRMVADIDELGDLVVRVLPPFVIALAVGAATVGLLWWLLPAAGLILGVALLLAGTTVPRLTGALARRREARSARARADLNSALVDLTEGSAELLAFGAAEGQLATIEGIDAELTGVTRSAADTAGVGGALTTLLTGLAGWGCLVVGIPAVLSGRLPRTDLAVVALVPFATLELVAALPPATQALNRVRQAAARVFGMLQAPLPVTEPARPASVPGGRGDLVARGVRARHPGATVPALRDVDLRLPTGRRVAVVGPSGAGKSTLAEVLLRFLATEAGTVRLDGVALDQLRGDDVRRTIGLVGQDAHLFDTTIAANLRIGRPSATDGDLREVLGRVGLRTWVEDLPDGLATEVGRDGGRVSGGQRRRLALARALLAEFDVLVVDEPAEHLDPPAADAVLHDLLAVAEARSLLLITHRLTGLDGVDEIVVMDGGRVVERGRHDALVARGGRYADLWWTQTGADPLAAGRHHRSTRTGRATDERQSDERQSDERDKAVALSGGHDTGSRRI